jgi:drug/metabolite transporter (DMT)-like permease
VAIATGGDPLDTRDVAIGAGAGAMAVLALAAFYRAMALGSISVVSTIGALGVLVPVIVGLARGETPSPPQVAGVALAIGGVVLVARDPDPEWRAASGASVGLAALAALGFGLFFVGLDLSSHPNPSWTVVAARAGGVAVLIAAAAFARPSLRVGRAALPYLVVIGFFDVLANSLFAIATNHGLLSLVSVGGSLYAAVTVLLARFVLGERLARGQRAGIACALAGVALIAGGAA